MKKLQKRAHTYDCSQRADKDRLSDVSVTVLTAENKLRHYHLHKHVLSAHSKYFKKQIVAQYTEDHIALPFEDPDEAFPYLVRFMYERRADFPAHIKLAIAVLAYRLDMPELLNHSTADLVSFMKDGMRYSVPRVILEVITGELARRVSRARDFCVFSGLPTEIMELVLCSQHLDVMCTNNLPQMVNCYMKTRQQKHKKNISLQDAQDLQNIAEQLMTLRGSITNAMCIASPDVSPFKIVKEIRHSFYEQLERCQNLSRFTFRPPTFIGRRSSSSSVVSRGSDNDSNDTLVPALAKAESVELKISLSKQPISVPMSLSASKLNVNQPASAALSLRIGAKPVARKARLIIPASLS